MDCRNLLVFFAAFCLVFPVDICVVEMPHQNENEPMSVMPLAAESRRPCQQAPLDQVACSRPWLPNALYWSSPWFKPTSYQLIRVSQGQLCTVYPLLNIDGSSPTSPTSPVSSKKLTALDHGIPVKSSHHVAVVAIRSVFKLHHGFQFLLLISHAASLHTEALKLEFLVNLPFWGSPPKNLWEKYEAFSCCFLKWLYSMTLLCSSAVHTLPLSNLA